MPTHRDGDAAEGVPSADAPEGERLSKVAKVQVAADAPLELMRKRNKAMHSAKSVDYGQSFVPRKSDVFVTTYPKCGTTWVTHICHLLRSNGSMDFEEISEVCPWDIVAFDCGQDLDADQVGNPRVFKSHERAGDIAKGGKYIHVCRRPEDAFISFYRFLPAFDAIPPGAITEDEFAEAIFGGVSHSGGIWDFFAEWWARRDDPDVMWVCFEDLKADLRGQIRRIAKFMDVPLTDDLLECVAERSSFAFMAAHSRQFDEHFVFEKLRDQMGIPADYVFGEVNVSKVRAGGGKEGEGAKLSQHVLDMLRKRWELTMQSQTGFHNYEDLRKAVGRLHSA